MLYISMRIRKCNYDRKTEQQLITKELEEIEKIMNDKSKEKLEFESFRES